MPKPREIYLGNNKSIKLHQFSKQESDIIQAFILKNMSIPDKEENVVFSPLAKGEVLETTSVVPMVIKDESTEKNLDNVSVGLNKNNAGSWELVHIKYNNETTEAQVVKVLDVGKDKRVAEHEFKLELVKQNII